jgi:hypothetical protein
VRMDFKRTVVGSTVLLGLSHSLLRSGKLGRSDDLHRLQVSTLVSKRFDFIASLSGRPYPADADIFLSSISSALLSDRTPATQFRNPFPHLNSTFDSPPPARHLPAQIRAKTHLGDLLDVPDRLESTISLDSPHRDICTIGRRRRVQHSPLLNLPERSHASLSLDIGAERAGSDGG